MTHTDNPANGYDVIIIGSGLGGLTAGALLSKRGKRVLMLEQHNVPGGCATAFKRQDYRVEVGLHAMGGYDDEDIKTKVFSDLGVFDNIKMLLLPEFYKYCDNEFQFEMPNSYPENMNRLIEQFPNEEKSIRKYFRRILKIRKQVNIFCSWSFRKQKLLFIFLPFILPAIILSIFSTIGGFLNRIFNSEQLKQTLLANLGYYHDNAESLSILFYAVGQGEYYKGGGYYIQGSSQELSDYLASVIENNGGTVRYRCEVMGINITRNRVTGVSYLRKNGSNSMYLDAYAKTIVCNAAIPQVADVFLSLKYKKKLHRKIRNQSLSPSFFMSFIVFKRPLNEFGNKTYSTIISGRTNNNTDEKDLLSPYHSVPFFFCDYSQLDSKLNGHDIGQGTIVCLDKMEQWEHLSLKNYSAKKKLVANILIDRLDKVIPGIKNEIKETETATPMTLRRYIRTPKGAVYGFAQTRRQAVPFRQSVKSSIRGLYFASAWAFPGGGFSGSILSGYTCAKAICPE